MSHRKCGALDFGNLWHPVCIPATGIDCFEPTEMKASYELFAIT
jgi:hypothetical protein